MQAKLGVIASAFLLVSVTVAAPERTSQTVVLTVPAGVPLRLYLTKRIPKKSGTPVEAKLLEPLYAFDHQVIPAGVVVSGMVTRVEPVQRGERLRAVTGGDFTPLHTAWIQFNSLQMPDGKELILHTVESTGMSSIISNGVLKTTAAQQQNKGVLGTASQKAKDTVHAGIDRAKGVAGLAKAPDKKERFYDFAMSKLPYHPQYLRKGTRFDADLSDPLSFGTEKLAPGALSMLGSEPAADSVAHARLITPLDSALSQKGEPVEAELSAPLFSSDHHVVMPEGTKLHGSVVVAKPARWLHRGGRLRFTFSSFDIPAPPVIASATPAPKSRALELKTRATLQAAESNGKSLMKIDEEGGVQAKESKTRFIAPAVSAWVARMSADNDPMRSQNGTITGQNPNVGGRTMGGGAGFGLLGAAAAQSSRYVGTAFGFYGLAWSVYSNILSRGFEVAFPKNTMVDVKFNTRAPAAPKHAGD